MLLLQTTYYKYFWFRSFNTLLHTIIRCAHTHSPNQFQFQGMQLFYLMSNKPYLPTFRIFQNIFHGSIPIRYESQVRSQNLIFIEDIPENSTRSRTIPTKRKGKLQAQPWTIKEKVVLIHLWVEISRTRRSEIRKRRNVFRDALQIVFHKEIHCGSYR